ncbi:MAG: hypothetical protein JWL91_1853, partial [Sphingomonas bacterium]|nr:hypothetical protein [Sphingomonas bacterium]
ANFAKLPQPIAIALTLELFHGIVPRTLRYGRIPDGEQMRAPLWSMPAPGPAVTLNA